MQLLRSIRSDRFPARNDYYIFITALVDFGLVTEKSFRLNNFRTSEITSHAQPFGQEPNAWFDHA